MERGGSFAEGVCKVSITRSAVLAQNAPQTVWWQTSARIRVKEVKIGGKLQPNFDPTFGGQKPLAAPH